MWKVDDTIPMTTNKFAQELETCFTRGFGSRDQSPCIGVNCYFGNHFSARPHPRPEAPSWLRYHHFYGKQNDKDVWRIPVIQKWVFGQALHVLKMVRNMNDTYMRLIQYQTCNRIFWTQGFNGERKNNFTNWHCE